VAPNLVHAGTSGWQYRDWRGVLYPPGLPQGGWLPRFTEVFETVEVNNSFYRLPERETFERWRRQTPSGFVMTVKASRYITHIRRLLDPRDGVERLWERARGLGPRLGPVLFQLPPRFPADVGRLDGVLRALPNGMRAAFEFRDPSWHIPDVHRLLERAGCALVWPDRPGVRAALPLTGGWAYIRFHQGTRAGPDYDRRKLRRWAERIAGLDVGEVFVYFNNDPGGAAVRDAIALHDLLRERGVPVATVPRASGPRPRSARPGIAAADPLAGVGRA
jgi:uncharacterized protein YecE (DUF72 family)